MPAFYELAELTLAVTGCVFLLLAAAFRLHVWQAGGWSAVLCAGNDREETLRRVLALRRLLEFCALEKQVSLRLTAPGEEREALQELCDRTFGAGTVAVDEARQPPSKTT